MIEWINDKIKLFLLMYSAEKKAIKTLRLLLPLVVYVILEDMMKIMAKYIEI
jgi:hypothetical protein